MKVISKVRMLTLMAIVLLTGCSTLPDGRTAIDTGVLFGTAGALGGAVIANERGKDPIDGATAGAGLGLLVAESMRRNQGGGSDVYSSNERPHGGYVSTYRPTLKDHILFQCRSYKLGTWERKACADAETASYNEETAIRADAVNAEANRRYQDRREQQLLEADAREVERLEKVRAMCEAYLARRPGDYCPYR